MAAEIPKIPKACLTGILIALDSQNESLAALPTGSPERAHLRRFVRRRAPRGTRGGTKLDGQPERLKWRVPGVQVGDFWVGD